AGLHPAVGPQLDLMAQTRFDERDMRELRADLRRQPDMLQRMDARRAGAAVEAGQRYDVRAGLGDPDRDRADAGDDRHLDDDLRLVIARFLQLADELRQILNRIDIMVVRRRDEVGADRRVPGGGDLLRHLGAWQMTALA